MEVDRISRMSGTGPQAAPAWTSKPPRRRRFVEEIGESASEPETQDEAAEAEETENLSAAEREESEDGLEPSPHPTLDLLA